MVTTYFMNKMLEVIFKSSDYDFPDTIYLGVSTSEPNISGEGDTEPLASSYTRLAISTTDSFFQDPVNGTIRNKVNFTFTEALTDWTTSLPISHLCIYDAQKGNENSHLLMYMELPTYKEVKASYVLEIPPDSFNTSIKNIDE